MWCQLACSSSLSGKSKPCQPGAGSASRGIAVVTPSESTSETSVFNPSRPGCSTTKNSLFERKARRKLRDPRIRPLRTVFMPPPVCTRCPETPRAGSGRAVIADVGGPASVIMSPAKSVSARLIGPLRRGRSGRVLRPTGPEAAGNRSRPTPSPPHIQPRLRR